MAKVKFTLDRQTAGRADRVIPIYPRKQRFFLGGGYKKVVPSPFSLHRYATEDFLQFSVTVMRPKKKSKPKRTILM